MLSAQHPTNVKMPKKKNAAAVKLGRRGGKATTMRRTPEQRAAQAQKAAEAHWAPRNKAVDSGGPSVSNHSHSMRAQFRIDRRELPLTTDPRTSRRLRRDESELQRYRRFYPELQLDDIEGDDLSVLFACGPDPAMSLKYWRAVSHNMVEGKFEDAAKQLIDLFRNHRFTFYGSGWVKTAIARLVLENEIVAKEFVKLYWREARRPPPEGTLAALQALELTRESHRKHWLDATRWMKAFYYREYQAREAVWRFVGRAVKEYRDSKTVRRHSCLQDVGLEAIATAIFEDPDAPLHELTDRALAKLHGTSASMVAHVRARLNRDVKAI